MEPEMNESFGQPNGSQSQPGSGPPPEQKPTSQQNSLQQTFLNLKLSTWIKCVVISIILSVAAVFIAPEFSTAQSGQTAQPRQQETFNSYCEYEEDMYDYSQYEDGWNDDYSDYQEDSSYDYYNECEDSSDDYGYESQNDWEDSWSDDYESVEEDTSYDYESEENWYDDYETEEDWSYETEADTSDDYEYQENTYEYDYYYDD